jgi:fumarate hydratase class II
MQDEKQTQPPILNMQMTPAGIELAIAALRKLPHEQVDPLVQELWAQYKQQMQQLVEVVKTAPDGIIDATPTTTSEVGSAELW